MDLTPYIASLRESLAASAAAGDEETRRVAAVLSAAVEPAARLALLEALSDLAAETTEALGDRVVDVRLEGREVHVVVSGGERTEAPSTGLRGLNATDGGWDVPPAGDLSRVTLRLVEDLKARAEAAAAARGVSLNAWLANAVNGALSGDPGQRRRHEHHDRVVRGWVQG